MNLVRKTLLIQGVYFVVTGIWPLISIASFMAVTGPKTDIWLVKTLALQITAIGIVLCFGALQTAMFSAVILLSVLSATGFIVADVYYSVKGVISPVYLADAVLQLIFLFIIAGYLIFRKKIEKEAIA